MTNRGIAEKRRQAKAPWPPLLRRMTQLVRSRTLFRRGDHLLVAVSGGPDSVALLALLHLLAPVWNLRLTAVHFNYGLRGVESDEDEKFVEQLARRLGVEVVIQRLDLSPRAAGAGRGSLQERARDLRYDALRTLARERSADRVVLGHTADDQLETFLLWLLRGAAATGLAGMPYEREGLFVRPMLDTTREEVLAYLDAAGFSYRTDSSNLSARFRRNRIRREVVPVLKRLLPGAAPVIRRQMDVLREDDRCLDLLTARVMDGMMLRRSDLEVELDHRLFLLQPLALQRRVIRRVLRELDPRRHPPSFRVVERAVRHLLDQSGSGRPCRYGDIELVREKDAVRIRKVCDDQLVRDTIPVDLEVPVSVPARVQWRPTMQEIELAHVDRKAAEQALASHDRDTAIFDADRISSALRLRTWQAGDTFYPVGMGGRRKKLQDFFVDIKLERTSRHRVPLLVAPEGILWVVGYRQDDRFVVRPSTQRYVLARVRCS